MGKLYGHFKGSVDTVKPHDVEVLHKNVAYYRTRAPLFSLSGHARERARVLRLARRPRIGSSPCMRLARSPCISTLGDAASTPSTAARSWTGLTRARKPVRATRCVSIRHPSARPCTHTRQAPQHAGPRRNPHSMSQTGRAGAVPIYISSIFLAFGVLPAAAPVRSRRRRRRRPGSALPPDVRQRPTRHRLRVFGAQSAKCQQTFPRGEKH